MAELFLAKQVGMEGFEKVVAIKRILAHLAYDEEFINMFRDEARIVAKLSHPNIVQIYDLGKSDDSYFIAMEYIPGRNLSSVAKKARAHGEKMPPIYVARCLAQAAEGLYYAHTRKDIDGRPLQIVHRDVSPQNIIVSFSGTVKLVDFGIAKAATKIAHTRAGVLKGKYAYMSPEQIRGEDTDARSDLFAVGIVLYELLCGRRPFEKDNSIQTLKAIVQDPHVDCRVHNPDIPDGLAAIIDKALEKDPSRRYQSAQEIQLALEDLVSSAPERCNNVTIANWVTHLFEEELSRERGGTVVFQGVGEVILPDVLDERPADAAAAQKVEPVVLSRGRGGGSVDTRPPIPAPSNSLVGRPGSMSSSGGRRGQMIEEGVIEREEDDGGWDDATVHGQTGASADLDATIPPPSKSDHVYSDDKTEFAQKQKQPLENETELALKRTSIPTTDDVSFSEEATLAPDEVVDPVVPEPEIQDNEVELLGPLDEAAADADDDPWDEATVGYPEGVAPIEDEDEDDDDLAVAGPAIPPAATRPLGGLRGEHPSDDLAPLEDSQEEVASLWDDQTSNGVSIDPVDGPGEPVLLGGTPDLEVSGKLELEGFDLEPSHDQIADATVSQAALEGGDATIAQPSLTDLPVDEDEDEDELPEGVSPDSEAGFNDDRTIGGPALVLARSVSDGFSDDRTTTGLKNQDATVAGVQALPDDPDDDELPMADVSDDGEATVGADDEPVLPRSARSARPQDSDARTVAGNSVDYLAAGVNPPRGGLYDQDDTGGGIEIELETRGTAPSAPAPKRGAQSLGAIRLSKQDSPPPPPVTRKNNAPIQLDYDPEEGHGMPGDSVDLFGMELSRDGDRSDAPPVQPTPLEDPGDDDPILPPSPREQYGALLPKMPVPLNPPTPMASGPMGIGSTNVPPAALSLSQVLSHPSRARASGMVVLPKGPPPTPGARGPSVLGRQIREVVRTDTVPPGRATPSLGSGGLTSAPPPMLLDPYMAGESEPASVVGVVPVLEERGRGRRVWVGVLVAMLVAAALSAAGYFVLPLLRRPGEPHLTIKTTPPGAQVLVDGVLQQGQTPLNITGLKPGTQYEIRLEMNGFEPASQTIVVPAGRPLIWQTALRPVGTPPP
ncbi:MAG: protein kinase [Deltaproteobacteria bacterium]|nr:protein kinase [Deltaproteobacteria bacterium]